MTEGDLAALIGSRLCHDLANPLGAIGNGVELLQMTQPPAPELELLAEAVKGAQARLQLFRLAFGAARDDQTVSPQQIDAALTGLEGRLSLRSDITGALPRPRARRLMLAVLCAETALAWGGTITVTETGVLAEAPRLRLDDGVWQALAAGAPPRDVVSAQVHFVLLAAGGPVTVEAGDTALRLTV
ncbi:histidine phosphotransferase family protein [Pararhodobacter sp.]